MSIHAPKSSHGKLGPFGGKAMAVLLPVVLASGGVAYAIDATPAHSSGITRCRPIAANVRTVMTNATAKIHAINEGSAKWNEMLTGATRRLDLLTARGHVTAADSAALGGRLGILRGDYETDHALVQELDTSLAALNASYERLQDITILNPDMNGFIAQMNSFTALVHEYSSNIEGSPAWVAGGQAMQSWYNNQLVPACARTGYVLPPLSTE
jgi:hypothetical protein